MWESMVGALVGGVFTLAGGWAALRWQTEHEARTVAAALLAEISVSKRIAEKGGINEFYRNTLDFWKENGEVNDPQSLADMFDNNPQDVLPVYFSMAPKLGMLPSEIASSVVEYHANSIAISKVVVRFMGQRDLDRDTVKAIAYGIEGLFHRVLELQAELIRDLSAFVTPPPKPILDKVRLLYSRPAPRR